MSLSVKIVDNETGEVYTDISDATCIMGAIARNGEDVNNVNTLHVQTKELAYVRCNRATIYYIMTALQRIIVDTHRRYPGIEHIGDILKMLKKMGGADGN